MTFTQEVTYLGGKVRKRTLPVYNGPADPGAPSTKRLLLRQGELAQIYDDQQPIHYLAFIELREDSVRGNHFHRVKEEFIYVLNGEAVLFLEALESKTRENVPLRAGDLAVISTGVAHALRTVRAGQAVEFSSARFDPLDIHRYPVI